MFLGFQVRNRHIISVKIDKCAKNDIKVISVFHAGLFYGSTTFEIGTENSVTGDFGDGVSFGVSGTEYGVWGRSTELLRFGVPEFRITTPD